MCVLIYLPILFSIAHERKTTPTRVSKPRCAMGLSKIPSAIRNMPFESLVNVIAPAKRPKPAEPEIDNRLKNIKSTVKQSTRKRKAANSAAVPSSATRSSSRSRTVEETPLASRTQHAKNNLFTPANNQTGGANFGMTPLITPKWNPMTPLARTAHRQARPNETTVSLNGSPVMGTMSKPRGRKRAKAADDGGEGFMTMPLGDDLVLNLPLGDAPVDTDSLDLDDDQLAKVAQANKMLVAMLKARGMSTDESD